MDSVDLERMCRGFCRDHGRDGEGMSHGCHFSGLIENPQHLILSHVANMKVSSNHASISFTRFSFFIFPMPTVVQHPGAHRISTIFLTEYQPYF